MNYNNILRMEPVFEKKMYIVGTSYPMSVLK